MVNGIVIFDNEIFMIKKYSELTDGSNYMLYEKNQPHPLYTISERYALHLIKIHHELDHYKEKLRRLEKQRSLSSFLVKTGLEVQS